MPRCLWAPPGCAPTAPCSSHAGWSSGSAMMYSHLLSPTLPHFFFPAPLGQFSCLCQDLFLSEDISSLLHEIIFRLRHIFCLTSVLYHSKCNFFCLLLVCSRMKLCFFVCLIKIFHCFYIQFFLIIFFNPHCKKGLSSLVFLSCFYSQNIKKFLN